MNANELADEFENRESHWKLINYIHWAEQAETMLRQQQAEIGRLKQIIDANNLNQNIGQFVKPVNEPVAWMHQNPDYAISKHQSLEYNIPLYTHPMRYLTDEKIWKLWQTHLNDDITVFVRAILKKASEK